MINKRTETTDELFERVVSGKKHNKSAKHIKHKNRKNRLVALIVAGIIAGTAAISALTFGIVNLIGKNRNQNKTSKPSKTSVVDTVDLSDMGTSLEFVEDDKMNQPKYGETTGNVDINKIVVSGKTIYKDEQAKENAKNIGKKETDTKNGTLVVEKDGTVKEKTPGYTYIDPKTKQTVSGEGEVPKGYTTDSAFEGLVANEEANKYVKLDKDLKDPETGEVLFKKGDRIEKTTLAKYEEYVRLYNSQKQNKTNSSSSTVSTQSTIEQKTNNTEKTSTNGTYTYDGVVFKDYNTFLAIADNEDFVSVNGVLWLKSDYLNSQNQKSR